MAATYDAIVVGGGHNGLVAAAYLARSGARTVVLEGRYKTGGAATTEAPWPDAPEFKVTRLSYVMSLMPPTIIRDLELERHGYKIYPMGPYYQAFPEGGSIKLYADDAKRNHEEVAKWSKADADAMPQLGRLAGRPGRRARPAAAHRAAQPRLAQAARPGRARSAWPGATAASTCARSADVTRLMTMSIADLLDDWFESPQVKGALAVNGVIGTWAGPYEPGTAYVMAHHSIGDVGDGHLGNWGFQEGGMGGVSSAIEAAARSHSARRSAPAPGSRGCWSRTAGRPASCSTTARNCGAKRGRVHAAPAHRVPRPGRRRATCPTTSSRDIQHWKTRSGVVKINLALGELPDFTADPGTQLQEHHTGSVEMAPTHGVHRARVPGRQGGPARGRGRSATA